MRTPPLVITYRSVTAAVTALIILFVAFGFAGYGPLTALHQAARPVTHELHLDRIGG
jgi:hypothetical protein